MDSSEIQKQHQILRGQKLRREYKKLIVNDLQR